MANLNDCPRSNVVDVPVPGVTDKNVTLTPFEVRMIATGLLIPNANAVHALARDWLAQQEAGRTNFTRQQIEATWAKQGTGEPLSEEKIAHVLRVLNTPVKFETR